VNRSPLRPVDFAAFDRSAYSAQVLWHGESCVVIASLVPAGKPAFRRHRHEHSDQLYYVVEGEMHARLGTEEHVVGPDSLVHIPRGLAHENWNEGQRDEFHLEVLAPSPQPIEPLATPTHDRDDDPPRPGHVRQLDEAAFVDTGRYPGFSVNRGVLPPDRAEHVALYVGEVTPGSAGPGLHVHPFDQFYFVLSGTLSVQLGLEQHRAGTGTLVAIPAGLPHRQWNADECTERHVTLIVAPPPPGQPFDVGVTLELSDEEID
jgi:mannose-6-phosphate isomerase-like protein (cupin superfamily)